MSEGPGGVAREEAPHWVRAPAGAGVLYPASPDRLRAMIQDLLASVGGGPSGHGPEGRAPKAVIAPHAGYRYSGPVAASAYVRWRSGGGRWSGWC